jgi:hypothetical protein
MSEQEIAVFFFSPHSVHVFFSFFITSLFLLCSLPFFFKKNPRVVQQPIRPHSSQTFARVAQSCFSRDGEGLLGRNLGAVPSQVSDLVAAVASLASGRRSTASGIGAGGHAVASVVVETLALVASDGLPGSRLGTEPTPHATTETAPKPDTGANATDVSKPPAGVALLPRPGPAETALHDAPEPSGTSDLDARAVGGQVAHPAARVALLRLDRARVRACGGFVAWALAVEAETRLCAAPLGDVANRAALEAPFPSHSSSHVS